VNGVCCDRVPGERGDAGEMVKDVGQAISAYIAKKIRQRVKDPKVADKLIPKDHGFGTRRMPLESGYFRKL